MIALALRNLSRHRKRTAIALATIGFGVVAMLLAGGFIEWVFWGMREGAIQSRLGHIQVTRPGYYELGSAAPYDYLLPQDTAWQADLAAMPEVDVATQRLVFNGLISHGDVTIGFTGEGVEPEEDEALSQHLIIASGQRLSLSDPEGMLLGRGLAENLGVTVGDRVVLLATTAGGGLNGIEGTVRGLFQSASKEFDDAALRLPIDRAMELVRASGGHVWVLLLNRTEDTDKVVEQLRLQYPESTSRLQFTPWHDLADFYNKTVKLLSRQMDFVKLIIVLIIGLSISNILVMSVLERTGEIGTLMAMGARRSAILRLFISEGILLGMVAGAVGVAAGMALAEVISAIGIPMPPPPGMDVGFTGRILVSWPLAAVTLGLAVVTTLLGSLYPAAKASRLEIVDALRHNR